MRSKKEHSTKQQEHQTKPCEPAPKNRLRTFFELAVSLLGLFVTLSAMWRPETQEEETFQAFAIVFAALDALRSALQSLI